MSPSFVERFVYDGITGIAPDRQQLLHILNVAHLEPNFQITYCQTLTDDIFLQAYTAHRYRHLKLIDATVLRQTNKRSVQIRFLRPVEFSA